MSYLSDNYVEETRFGLWFLRSYTWQYRVLRVAIDDLRSIAQLGYDEDEDQEELEMSLEEIIEYVRVAALLCHDSFTRPQPTAPEVQKPTLH